MAERPIFIPLTTGPQLVNEIYFPIVWHSGFAPSQKKKNIEALHKAAETAGYSPLLEISTKSDEKIGQRLSAFSLRVKTKEVGDIPLECAFQGSKIFEQGGPYKDLYRTDPRQAKRDSRLQVSGKLIGFEFESFLFPIEPKTAFYDWLYITAIFPHREWLSRLHRYTAFTDIEFNPIRSINCQARSCALFLALKYRNLLEGAAASPTDFVETLTHYSYHPALHEPTKQSALLDLSQQHPTR
jgi:hypothetical protein